MRESDVPSIDLIVPEPSPSDDEVATSRWGTYRLNGVRESDVPTVDLLASSIWVSEQNFSC